MVDGAWEVSGPRLVRNDLVVASLSRDWHTDTLTCTAANTYLVPPVSESVTIHMHCKYNSYKCFFRNVYDLRMFKTLIPFLNMDFIHTIRSKYI